MGLSEMYHVGVIVPDVDAGRARLTELLGISWGPIVETTSLVRSEDAAVVEVELRLC